MFPEPLSLKESLQIVEICEELKHLTSNEIISLVERYKAGEKKAVLVQDYNIKYKGKFENLLPPVVFPFKCPYCNTNIQREWNSTRLPSCPICSHQGNDKVNCGCENCSIKYQPEVIDKDKKEKYIFSCFGDYFELKVLEDKLTVEQKFYLSALLRGGIDGQLENLTCPTNLTALDEFTREIMVHLIENRIILPNLKESINEFRISDIKNNCLELSSVLNWEKAKFNINVLPDGDNKDASDGEIRKALIQRLYYLESSLFLKEPDFRKTIKHKIELSECLSYLEQALKEWCIYPFFTPKTKMVIEGLLNRNHSVNKIYRIIDYAIESVLNPPTDHSACSFESFFGKRRIDRYDYQSLLEEVEMKCLNTGNSVMNGTVELKEFSKMVPKESVIRQLFNETIAGYFETTK